MNDLTNPTTPAPPVRMVTRQKRHTSHGLHLVLTIITGGLWGLFVWLPLTIVHMLHKEKVRTDVY